MLHAFGYRGGLSIVKRWILIDLSGLYQWPKALTHLLMKDMNCLALGIHNLQIMGATSKCFLLSVLNVPLVIHPPVEVVYNSSRHTIRPIWPWWTRLSALLLHICVYQFLFATEFRLIADSGSTVEVGTFTQRKRRFTQERLSFMAS